MHELRDTSLLRSIYFGFLYYDSKGPRGTLPVTLTVLLSTGFVVISGSVASYVGMTVFLAAILLLQLGVGKYLAKKRWAQWDQDAVTLYVEGGPRAHDFFRTEERTTRFEDIDDIMTKATFSERALHLESIIFKTKNEEIRIRALQDPLLAIKMMREASHR